MRRIALFVVSSLVACGGGGDTESPPDAPGLSGDLYSVTWGPVTVQPGQENTQCIQVRLTNAAAIKVHQMHNVLGPGSHHLIVYRDDLTTEEQTTPFNCQPFTGALNPSGMVAPMMITQRSDDPLYLPEGVAYTMNPNQMMRVEMHFINATDNPIEATATVELYAAPEGSIHDEANILFIGSPDINIPAGGTATVDQFFTPKRAQLDLAGAKFFAITGHTHQLGTEMTVDTATTNSGTDKVSVYAPAQFEWDEPATQTHKPEFTIPEGNQAGFQFKCVYNNPDGPRVGFGESANDEMCFFWAYYYPSQGAHVCFHTQQLGGLDVCCPDAGPQLCDMISQQL